MDYASAIENAVQRFYSIGDNEAHSWLLQIQASQEAWTFLWDLLDSSKASEVQFFGANTLYAKVTKQWDEVPKNEYPALQNRILEILKRTGISELVVSRLCQTLSAFLVNCSASDNGGKAKGMVDELTEMLPYNTPNTVPLLLRVLEAIPGEFDRRQSTKRIKLREHLVGSCSKTTWLLQQVFSSCNHMVNTNSGKSIHFLALECLLSWLKVGHLSLDMTAQIFPHLLAATSHYLPNKEEENVDLSRGWDIIVECLTMIIVHPELHKRPQLLWQWAKDTVQKAQEHGGEHYYEILTTFGEAHSRDFLLALVKTNEEHKWTSQNLIELLLECSELAGRYPTDEKRSCIPFGFWYSLQDDLLSLDPPFENEACYALKPIYARLAQALLRKATLPITASQGGTAEEKELLRCYRQDAADTLMYCYNVLGHDLLFLLGQRLNHLQDDSQNWTDVESTIHAIKALSESVGTQECQYVPAIMDLVIGHVPYGHYPKEVLCCSCLMLGAYAEWIGEHPEPWLERSLQLVTLGLTQGQVTSPAASMALKDITRECAMHMAPLAPTILETISRTLPNVTPGGGEGLRLMYAAGKLLISLSSTEQQIAHLQATLGLCVIRLQELLQHPVNEAQLAVANQLKMITTFFTTLEGAIGNAVLEGLLPTFEQIIRHPEWSRDDVTLDAMLTCAQKSLSALQHPEVEAKPLLSILSISYKTKPHPAALSLLKQLVPLFGRDRDNVVGPVLTELSGLTLRGVASCREVGGNLSDLSDLLEAYLELLAQICKKNARMLLHIPDQVPEMLRCGISCLTLPETATERAAGSFLSQAIMQSPHLQTFIQPIGQELVYVILQCVGGAIPRNNLEPHAGVMLALNKTCPDWTGQWMRHALADPSAPLATQGQKDSFVREIMRERVSKWRLWEKLKDFSLKFRQNPTMGL